MLKTKQSKSKKPSTGSETSESIALQTAAFLEAGGKVEIVDRGVSGYERSGDRKQISYTRK